MNEITKRTIEDYKNYLVEEEKCSVTIEKYIRDITAFVNWTEGNEITKALVLEYKSMLTQQYAPASVNSALVSSFSLWQKICLCTFKFLTLRSYLSM